VSHHTPESIAIFVTERYIRSEQGSTVKEIAEGLNISQSKVRKLLVDAFGCPDGLNSYEETRPSYSTNYPGVVVRHHTVEVYYPSLRRLAQKIREFRSAF
jgi:hypothetical protein